VDQEIEALSQPPDSSDKSNSISKSTSPRSYHRTSLLRQYQLVQKRSFQLYLRSPVYIRGKVILNVVAGLFLGFTFYNEKNSAQGLQNKLFATFTSCILSARKLPLSTLSQTAHSDKNYIWLTLGNSLDEPTPAPLYRTPLSVHGAGGTVEDVPLVYLRYQYSRS
jgi:ABC-2 type transporter